MGAADFSFVLGQGSGWHGYNTLRVSASGRCECRYHVVEIDAGNVRRQAWRKAEFRLTAEIQRQVRASLEAADFFGLDSQYINRRIADGTQRPIALRASDQEKRIYCSNTFPEALRKLSRAIREQIVVLHRLELVTATRLENGRYNPEKDGWFDAK